MQMIDGNDWTDRAHELLEMLRNQDTTESYENTEDFIALEHPQLFTKIKDKKAAAAKFLLQLVNDMTIKKMTPTVFFHDDADGVTAAAIAYKILKKIGASVPHENFHPLTHQQLDSVDTTSGCRLFIDIQPRVKQEGDFIIDHHRLIDDNFKYRTTSMIGDDSIFVYWPENEVEEFLVPASSSILTSYLWYILDNVSFDLNDLEASISRLEEACIGLIKYMNMLEYIHGNFWHNNIFMRNIVLMGAVSDNLWQLSFSDRSLVKRWSKSLDYDEKEFIKDTIVISLLLGDTKKRGALVDGILTYVDYLLEGNSPDTVWAAFKNDIDQLAYIGENIMKFSSQLYKMTKEFRDLVSVELSADISDSETRLERYKKDLETYKLSMPVQLRNSKDKTMGMLESSSSPRTANWKRIEFFSDEIKRLERSISIENNRMEMLKWQLKKARDTTSSGAILFMPKQSSEQVKGIMASLLYYFGLNNIVLEDTSKYTSWGSRGLKRAQLEKLLTTLSIDKSKLDYYLSVEEEAGELSSAARATLKGMSKEFYKAEYVGGGGGRGLIFGGSIKGRVPQFFALFEPDDMMQMLSDLVSHGELSSAVKSLTERGSQVPLTKALKVKFKDSNWVMINIPVNGGTGDVLKSDVSQLEMWLAGIRKDFKLNDKK